MQFIIVSNKPNIYLYRTACPKYDMVHRISSTHKTCLTIDIIPWNYSSRFTIEIIYCFKIIFELTQILSIQCKSK